MISTWNALLLNDHLWYTIIVERARKNMKRLARKIDFRKAVNFKERGYQAN